MCVGNVCVSHVLNRTYVLYACPVLYVLYACAVLYVRMYCVLCTVCTYIIYIGKICLSYNIVHTLTHKSTYVTNSSYI